MACIPGAWASPGIFENNILSDKPLKKSTIEGKLRGGGTQQAVYTKLSNILYYHHFLF